MVKKIEVPKNKKVPKLTYDKLLKKHLKILKDLQYDSGLFAASSKNVSTGYDKSWLRDNFYETMAFQVLGDWDTVLKTYNALLQIFLKHEYKIDHAIANKPQNKHEYIHARYHPTTFDEFWEEWGNMQNDAIGEILFTIAKIEQQNPKSILKDENHVRVINKLVQYLDSLEYWHDDDNGIWENENEIHASSIGACLSGLKEINKIKGITVPKHLITAGQRMLNELLPRESSSRAVDLALLTLIYPFNIVSKKQRDTILDHVEYYLVKRKGVVRYKNDWYYNNNPDGFSEDAEWTFGFSWMAIIYEKLENKEKANFFINKMIETDTSRGIPELYFSNTNRPNENTPLGWAESLFLVALHDYNELFEKRLKKHHKKYTK